MNIKTLLLKKDYRANIYAHAGAVILNSLGFFFTGDNIFIWTQLAALSFIGTIQANSPRFLDRNINNQFVSVCVYYMISHLILPYPDLYFMLIFVFTYVFYILKDNGYNKSLTVWMFIQVLLIGTMFVNYPFSFKILATVMGFVEAQVLLNITFLLFPSPIRYHAERRYLDVVKIPLSSWIDIRRLSVQLALRGSLVASSLYVFCSYLHDVKPNWAVISAVSALIRDDRKASLRTIKSTAFASFIAWPICLTAVYYFSNYITFITICLWLFIILSLKFAFDNIKDPSVTNQTLSTGCTLIALACLAISLHIAGVPYINLKVMNTLLGIGVALWALWVWELLKYLGLIDSSSR